MHHGGLPLLCGTYIIIVGGNNPRLDNLGHINCWINSQFQAYVRAYPPLDRMQPVTISLLHKLCHHICDSD